MIEHQPWVILVGGRRDNFRMRQLQFFTSAELARMRDRTAARNYSPERDEFRREHERHRAWGLIQRHNERLRRLRNAPPAASAPENRRQETPRQSGCYPESHLDDAAPTPTPALVPTLPEAQILAPTPPAVPPSAQAAAVAPTWPRAQAPTVAPTRAPAQAPTSALTAAPTSAPTPPPAQAAAVALALSWPRLPSWPRLRRSTSGYAGCRGRSPPTSRPLPSLLTTRAGQHIAPGSLRPPTRGATPTAARPPDHSAVFDAEIGAAQGLRR
jgi:hypothetical protein